MKKFLLYILVSIASIQFGFSINLGSPTIDFTEYTIDGHFRFHCTDTNKLIIPAGHALYVYNKNVDNYTLMSFPITTYPTGSSKFTIDIYPNFNDTNRIKYNLNDSVVQFVLESYLGLDTTNMNKQKGSIQASNVLLKCSFDDCTSKITLNWNKFYGYADQIYKIRYKISDTKPIANLTLPLSDNTNTSTIIDNNKSVIGDITNKKIWFQVFASKVEGSVTTATSISNIILVDTKTSTAPGYINAYGTEVLDNGSIKLKFAIDPVRDLNKFIIQGSTDNNSGSVFKTINTITIFGSDTTITIPNPQNFYKLSWLNKCNNPVFESNVESKITLSFSYSNDNDGVILNWTPYQSFNGSSFHYDVYRIRDGVTELLNKNPLDSTKTTFTDPVNPENLSNKKLVEELIYYIEAVEDVVTEPIGHAISNKILATLTSKPIFPKVIVPNAQGDKSQTNFCITNIESGTYKLIIFDRWGTKVCETDDAINGWNGRYANGNPAPEGMYMYYFKISAAGKSSEFKGTFALVIK